MKRIYLFLCLSLLALTACNKDDDLLNKPFDKNNLPDEVTVEFTIKSVPIPSPFNEYMEFNPNYCSVAHFIYREAKEVDKPWETISDDKITIYPSDCPLSKKFTHKVKRNTAIYVSVDNEEIQYVDENGVPIYNNNWYSVTIKCLGKEKTINDIHINSFMFRFEESSLYDWLNKD